MKKLYTHHSIYLLFLVCWLSYFSAYLGRLNFTACIAAINEAENLSKLELGRVSSAFFVCYGGAQLFSGLLADRLRPRLLVAVGLLGGAAVNLGMALSSTAGQMVVLWAVNGLLLTPGAADGMRANFTMESLRNHNKPHAERSNLSEQIAHKIGGGTSQLNPLFVAEMMNFPLDWLVSPFLGGGRKP